LAPRFSISRFLNKVSVEWPGAFLSAPKLTENFTGRFSFTTASAYLSEMLNKKKMRSILRMVVGLHGDWPNCNNFGTIEPVLLIEILRGLEVL